MAKKDRELVVGLDIGTTKICTVVGERLNGSINIIGLGSYPSRGLRRGVVVNIETTVESIRKAVDEASLMAGCDIRSVYAGIAGGHIKGINRLVTNHMSRFMGTPIFRKSLNWYPPGPYTIMLH